MQFKYLILAAALLLSVSAAPGGGVAIAASEKEIDIDAHAKISRETEVTTTTVVGVKEVEDVEEINIHYSNTVLSQGYHKCLSSEAHGMYNQALDIYHRASKLMLHTLCKEGTARQERLLEIAFLIQRGENILLAAGIVNEKDAKWLRRHWVRHEVKHLKDRFAFMRIRATHLPNLAFAAHAYHFVVDVITGTIKFVASIPGLVLYGLQAAAHAVHVVLHTIKEAIGWVINEIEEEIIYIGHKIHQWGHDLKEKIHDRWELHKEHQHERWQRFKGHFRHHKCEDSDSCSSCSSSDDSCSGNNMVQVVQEEETEVDISIKWTRKQAEYEVVKCVKEIQKEEVELDVQLKATEKQVLAAAWENDDEE